MCTSTTTTEVKTGEMSARGDSYDQLFTQIMSDDLAEFGGYSVDTVRRRKYEDPEKAAQLQSQLSALNKQIYAQPPPDPRTLSSLTAQKNNLQNQLNDIPSQVYTDYDLTKMEDVRVRNLIDKYGEDSPQVAAMREQVKQEEVYHAEAMAGVEKNYLTNVQKYTSGDYSYTPEQYQQISKFIDPIRDAVLASTNELLSQYGHDDAMLRSSLGDVLTEIDKTGFAIGDALNAARIQIEKSGETLFNVLKGVNDSAEKRAMFQFDLLSEQSDQQAAQQAALLGLPPGSQSEKFAAMKMKTDALKQIELDLAYSEQTGALNIQSGVEAGKKQISLAEVSLAESQGAKKENAAQLGFGLTEILTNKIDQALASKGNALIGTEQQRSKMLYDAAFGNLPGMISAGGNVMSLDENLKTAEQQRNLALLNPIEKQLQNEIQRQFAETTTTQKTKKSFLDSFTDVLGGLASVGGAVMGFGGFGGGGGSSGGGGGGGAPQSFMPTPQVFNTQPVYLSATNAINAGGSF